MREVLKHRLVGALVFLAVAFLAVSLLPEPGTLPQEEGVQRLTIDLNAPVAPTRPESQPSALPAVIAAQEPPVAEPVPVLPPAENDVAPRIETPGAEPTPALAPSPAQPAPPPKSAAQVPAPTESAKPVLSKPAPAAVEPVAPKPAAAPPVAPAAPRELKLATRLGSTSSEARWLVQVGGFLDIGNARQTQDRLKAGGFPSLISPTETAKGTLYRVRVGPYSDKDAANAARARVAELGFTQAALITP